MHCVNYLENVVVAEVFAVVTAEFKSVVCSEKMLCVFITKKQTENRYRCLSSYKPLIFASKLMSDESLPKRNFTGAFL